MLWREALIFSEENLSLFLQGRKAKTHLLCLGKPGKPCEWLGGRKWEQLLEGLLLHCDMGLKDRWGVLAPDWLPCPRTGCGFHPTAPTAQPWWQHNICACVPNTSQELPLLPLTFPGDCASHSVSDSRQELGTAVLQVCVTCVLLVGKTRAIVSLGGIFLVTQVQTPGTRFRVVGVCQPSQSEMLLKLCRGWGCQYRFYIKLGYHNYCHLFSGVLFSCVCVCMRERRKEKEEHLATAAEKVQSLILSSERDGTLQLTHAQNFKKQIVDDRVCFMRPDSPTSQVALQYEEVCTSVLLRSFKYRDISR